MLGGLLGGSGLLGGIGQLLGGFLGSSNAAGIGRALEGFSPANIINATANLVNSIVGNSAKETVNTLHKEDGMPKFVRDTIYKAIDDVVKQYQKKVDDPKAQDALNEATKDDALKEIKDLTKKLLDKVRDIMDKNTAEQTQEAGGSASGAGKKKSAKSWFAAIAEAMGKVYGAKTAEVVRLTEIVSNVADKQSALNEKAKGVDSKNEKGNKDIENERQKLAAEMTKAQTELQAASQEMKLISETVSTLLKSVGEALATMARKQ